MAEFVITMINTCILLLQTYITAKEEARLNGKRESHNAAEGYISNIMQPMLGNDGITMQLGDQNLNIASPHFEELLLNLYLLIDRQIMCIQNDAIRQTVNVEFNQNMYQFVKDVLLPARYNAFKAGDVASNSYIHMLHRSIMRRLYIALAEAKSPLVPDCWLAVYEHMDTSIEENTFKEFFPPIGWDTLNCDEFFEGPFPDVSITAVKIDDVDLSAPRIVTPDKLQIRGHSYYEIDSVEYTEDAILRFDSCVRMRIDQIENDIIRQCYTLTFDLNMGEFVSKLREIAELNGVCYEILFGTDLVQYLDFFTASFASITSATTTTTRTSTISEYYVEYSDYDSVSPVTPMSGLGAGDLDIEVRFKQINQMEKLSKKSKYVPQPYVMMIILLILVITILLMAIVGFVLKNRRKLRKTLKPEICDVEENEESDESVCLFSARDQLIPILDCNLHQKMFVDPALYKTVPIVTDE